MPFLAACRNGAPEHAAIGGTGYDRRPRNALCDDCSSPIRH